MNFNYGNLGADGRQFQVAFLSRKGKVVIVKSSIKIKSVVLMVLIVLANYLSGCSVVGLGVGSLIDKSQPEYKRLEKDQLLSVASGTNMTLYMEDGSWDYGKIGGYTAKTPMEPERPDADSSLTVSDRMLIFKSSVYSDSALRVKYIPMSSVSHAQVSNTRFAKYIGFGIGLLIDISILKGIDSFFSEPFMGPAE